MILNYLRAFLNGVSAIDKIITKDGTEELEIGEHLTVEVATSSYKTIRGRTVIAALCDEAAFWSDETGANPASEVLKSLRPAMATIPNALLFVASSPYAKAGPLYQTYKKYFGVDGPILVWQAATWQMNLTLPQDSAFIKAAFEEDEVSAAAEYGARFRSDISGYVSREVVESLVPKGTPVRPYEQGKFYNAFFDGSGGSGGDSQTLAIAHMEGDKPILDLIAEWKPPFSPHQAVGEAAAYLKTYFVKTVKGDRWGGQWPRDRFKELGIEYHITDLVRSDIYREGLPLLNAGKASLLDNTKLINQLCALERTLGRNGNDTINHPSKGHDDVANVAMGALVHAAMRKPPQIARSGPIVLTAERPNESNYNYHSRY